MSWVIKFYSDIFSTSRCRYFSVSITFVVTSFVYFSTVAPGLIQFGDSPKFQFIGLVNGIPHPTGYPLYILISKLFLAVTPFSNVALSMNVMSAIFAIFAVVLVHLTVLNLTKNSLIGLLIALTFALSRTFWSQAIIAEVYTLNAFCVALVLWFVILWEETNDIRYFYLAWATICIGLGNHATLIFFTIGLMSSLLITDIQRLKTWSFWLIISSTIFLTLLQYLYLFWLTQQDLLYSEFEGHSWGDFLLFVAGGGFQSRFLATDLLLGFQQYQLSLVTELTVLMIGLATVGAVALFSRQKTLLYLLFSFAGYLLFTITYSISDIVVYYIPLYLIVSVLAGVGLDFVFNEIAKKSSSMALNRTIQGLMIGVFLILPTHLYYSNFELGDWFLEEKNSANLRRQLLEVPQNSIVFTPENRDWWRVLYLKHAEGYLADSQIIKFEEKLPKDKPAYAVSPDFDPINYHVRRIHVGESLASVLSLTVQDDIIVFVVRNLTPLTIPVDLARLFKSDDFLFREIETKENLVIAIKNYAIIDRFELEDKNNEIVISAKGNDNSVEYMKGINFEAFVDASNDDEMIEIIFDEETVLKTQDFGLLIIDGQTQSVIESGSITRDTLLVNDVVLYEIMRNN